MTDTLQLPERFDATNVDVLFRENAALAAPPYEATGVDDYADFSDPTVVPLPAAAWLFGSALVGAGIVGRRKKKAA